MNRLIRAQRFPVISQNESHTRSCVLQNCSRLYLRTTICEKKISNTSLFVNWMKLRWRILGNGDVKCIVYCRWKLVHLAHCIDHNLHYIFSTIWRSVHIIILYFHQNNKFALWLRMMAKISFTYHPVNQLGIIILITPWFQKAWER